MGRVGFSLSSCDGCTKVQNFASGQAITTIPINVIDKLDIDKGDMLHWIVQDGQIIVKVLPDSPLKPKLRFG